MLVLLLFLSFVISAFSLPLVSAAEDSWTTMTPPPTSFSSIGAAAVDGKIYLFGTNTNVQYDPETNTWTPLAPSPIPNYSGTFVACQNKIYLIPGYAENPTQIYDPTTDTWENRTSIPTTRNGAQVNVVDGKIYVIGGLIPSPLGVINPSSANDVYDPETDSWSIMESIPTPVGGAASAVVDDKIYIIGGANSGGPDYSPINQVQIFDPKTNQWTNGTPIPTGVFGAMGCATTGLSAPKRIYVIGGTLNYYYRYPPDAIDLNQVYDPITDTWTTGTPMLTPRSGFAVAVVNDELYVIKGEKGDNYTDINEKYTPIGYIPEFPSWTPLLIMTIVVLLVSAIYRRKITKHNGGRKE